MSSIMHNLARRGVQHLSSATFAVDNTDKTFEEKYKMPTWGVVMLATTAGLFLLGMSMIEYTFGRLIPTLLMIETPQAHLYEPLHSLESDAPLDSKDGSKPISTDPELILVRPKPITSSFRTTILHLRSKAGRLSRFRGFGIFMVYSMLLSTLSNSLSVLPFVPRGTAPIFATLLLANLSLAWTQIVISSPSPKAWFRRLPAARTWKKVAGPTAVLAIAEQVAILLPAMTAVFMGLGEMDPQTTAKLSAAEKQILLLKGLAVFAIGIALSLLVVIPANVSLTRVQASLLNDEEESIVPFDRSFGGKVIPEIVGGSGVLGMLEAWKTFDWNARVRLVKAYVKVFAMQVGLTVFFIAVAVGQLFLIVGKSDLKKLIFIGEEELK